MNSLLRIPLPIDNSSSRASWRKSREGRIYSERSPTTNISSSFPGVLHTRAAARCRLQPAARVRLLRATARAIRVGDDRIAAAPCSRDSEIGSLFFCSTGSAWKLSTVTGISTGPNYDTLSVLGPRWRLSIPGV